MSNEQHIPYGYCHCGCGQETSRSPVNCAPRGLVKGEPRKYITGHNMRPRPAAERFWPKVNKDASGGCWEWTAATRNGYALFFLNNPRRWVYGHRWSYESEIGPIPEGLHIDHLCRNRACVNPAHLEPVTQAENNRRALRGRNERGQFA